MNHILIVEDEVKISRFLQLELQYEGYQVSQAFTGREGLEKALNETPDLIILDIMLPELNGIEVCRKIRLTSDVPIIMLTAKDTTMDIVMGLDMGANDYVTKPFAIEVLLARIRAALKNSSKSENINTNVHKIRSIQLNDDSHTVKYNDDNIDLTKTEYDLLKYLIINKNIALSRDQILNEVWGYDYCGDTNIVDVYIRYLRAKIDGIYDEKYIHTVRGVGYMIKDE